MHFYLVRHGEAKADTEDPARPLSDRGSREVRRVARHAATLRLEVAEIRHSGKLRARQTAEIMAEHLSPRHGVRETEGLGPNDDPEKARAELEAARQPLMFVGHLPHLSRLASALLIGEARRDIIKFEAGAIVCLDRADVSFRLLWILTPELARAQPSGAVGG